MKMIHLRKERTRKTVDDVIDEKFNKLKTKEKEKLK